MGGGALFSCRHTRHAYAIFYRWMSTSSVEGIISRSTVVMALVFETDVQNALRAFRTSTPSHTSKVTYVPLMQYLSAAMPGVIEMVNVTAVGYDMT